MKKISLEQLVKCQNENKFIVEYIHANKYLYLKWADGSEQMVELDTITAEKINTLNNKQIESIRSSSLYKRLSNDYVRKPYIDASNWISYEDVSDDFAYVFSRDTNHIDARRMHFENE